MDELPIVPDAELEFDSDLIFTYQGRPFSGVAYEESQTLGRSEVSYCEGVQEGLARDWYPSGILKAETRFARNDRHGRYSEYDESGNLVEEGLCEYGILVRRTRFDSDGNAVSSFAIDHTTDLGGMLDRLRREDGRRDEG
ncbi:toxin-antitoxin system YwqK family antitoxin [Amycolatopsis sp. WGS_07]|uniref:toxin-antitoxin system YwqK family antitoxin n=1 Tax=Amycolatopsis sp. WGS_07 TaxID=3076764 RepID=UPI003873239D